MLIRETKAVLESMLDAAEPAPSVVAKGDVQRAVEMFRHFAALPVEDAQSPDEDGDGILAQFGTYELRGQREFSADLTRQLTEAGGESASTWQLSCTLYWASSTATDDLASGRVWSFGKTLDRFFDEAVALPGWAWALSSAPAPRNLVIMLDRI